MPLDTYGRLEVMGHQSFVGKLSEETVCGVAMARVDYQVGEKTVTKFFGGASIYAITPMSEEEVKEIERYAAARLLAPRAPTVTFDEPDEGYGQAGDDDGYVYDGEEATL